MREVGGERAPPVAAGCWGLRTVAEGEAELRVVPLEEEAVVEVSGAEEEEGADSVADQQRPFLSGTLTLYYACASYAPFWERKSTVVAAFAGVRVCV